MTETPAARSPFRVEVVDVLVEASSRPSLLLAVGGFEFEFVVLSRAS
jgi:hypothetical protein